MSADAEENEHVLSTPPYWAPSVVGPAFLPDTKHRFSGAHGSGRGAPRATAGAEASCAEEAIERPRPDEAGSRPGDRLTPVGDRGIVASWRRRTRACLRAGRCVMKHVARAFLLAAVVLTLGGHRDALAGGCKPDGRTCRTNQSCCSRLCAKAPTAKFGVCCTPDCTGNVCGDDGCGGSCGECTCHSDPAAGCTGSCPGTGEACVLLGSGSCGCGTSVCYRCYLTVDNLCLSGTGCSPNGPDCGVPNELCLPDRCPERSSVPVAYRVAARCC